MPRSSYALYPLSKSQSKSSDVHIIIIIIIEGLSLLQSIPPTTADKQTQAQKRRGSRSRKQYMDTCNPLFRRREVSMKK